MDHSLHAIKNRLAACADRDLRVLITAADAGDPTTPALLSWLNAACRWELNRRRRLFGAGALPPFIETRVGRPGMDSHDVDVLLALRARIADLGAQPVFAVLDELENLLTDRAPRDSRRLDSA